MVQMVQMLNEVDTIYESFAGQNKCLRKNSWDHKINRKINTVRF